MTCFVYVLTDPATQEWKYVGITRDPTQRLRVHVAHALSMKDGYWRERGRKAEWIRALHSEGRRPDMVVLEETENPAKAAEIEKSLIAAHGSVLLNASGGGETGRPASLKWLWFDERVAILLAEALLQRRRDLVLEAIELGWAIKWGGSAREAFSAIIERANGDLATLEPMMIGYGMGCLPAAVWRHYGEKALCDGVREVSAS